MSNDKKKEEEKVSTKPSASDKLVKKTPEAATEEKTSEKKKKPSTVKKGTKKKPSKRYNSALGMVEKNRAYSAEEAISLAKKTATTKFDGSIEVHIRLGVDVKKSDQQVRSSVGLPHGTGKTKTIAVFVSEAKEKEAKAAGADIVGGQDLINEIKQTGKVGFEVAIATPDMMPKLAVIAKILGPKGLMPSPKNDTITTNIHDTIDEMKKGKVNFRSDDTGNIHANIGKTSFEDQKLRENFEAFLEAVKRAKPSSSKGTYIQKISINATMGPGILVQM